MLQFSVQNNQLSVGYDAFNNEQWEVVRELFCDDSPPKPAAPKFPAWHVMDSDEVKVGRDAIIEHLQDLRAQPTTAQLLGVASHGTSSITLDFTSSTRKEGDHVCADRIVFDHSGHIKEVWHCASGTHRHDDAGGEEPNSGS